MTKSENTSKTSNLSANKTEKQRRFLLSILLLVSLLVIAVSCLFLRYLLNSDQLSNQLPLGSDQQDVPPSYLKMITGVDGPVGVAVSPDGKRVYVSESKGERLIKIFDNDGNFLDGFAPPGTEKTNRILVYLAVSPDGRLFVTDRYNAVIDIFDADGNFIDAIIARKMTLSRYVKTQTGTDLPPGTKFHFDNINRVVVYQKPGLEAERLSVPARTTWNPLGIRFDADGNLMITNLVAGQHQVLIYSAEMLAGDLENFSPTPVEFGAEGNQEGQFSFPNSVVKDSRGNYYISDGNNRRISTWSSDLSYKTYFGTGSTEQILNLPRGTWMDPNDRLYIADVVGHTVRVYDVSGIDARFLFNIGEFGTREGFFNFPSDLCLDSSGRLYVANTENNRIDIWSY